MPAKKKTLSKPRTKKVQVIKQQPESNLRSAIFGLLVLAAFGIGFYSIQTYNKTEIETVNIPGNIKHVDANLEITICGKVFDLPKDRGTLDNIHTHKEKNVLHWHGTGEGDSDRTTKNLMEIILKDEIPKSCTAKGIPIKLDLTVNGQVQTDPQNYIWEDSDKLTLTFE